MKTKKRGEYPPLAEPANSRWSGFQTEGRRRPLPKGGVFVFLLVLVLLVPFEWWWIDPLLDLASLYPRLAGACFAAIGIGLAVWVWKMWSEFAGEGRSFEGLSRAEKPR